MRRSTVNILIRTCWRNADNFFAASRRRTSASAITRFTRLLSCPCGRLSRHLFGFFFLFFFPAEKPGFLSLFRFVGRSVVGFGPSLARSFCRFHLKNKLRSHVVIQFDRDLVFAGVLDRALKENSMPI